MDTSDPWLRSGFAREVLVQSTFDPSGDEAILINQMVSDRSKPFGYGYVTSMVMSRDYVSGRGSRDVWTSDAALVGGGLETSGLATQIVWGLGAETIAFDAALEGGGTETDCTTDAAYVYIYPYEEMRGVWTSYMLSSHCLCCVCVML
ncbi:hypothetical protein YC2023_098879 [Brassica napus]